MPLNLFSLLFEFLPLFDVFDSREFKVSRVFVFVIDNSISQSPTMFPPTCVNDLELLTTRNLVLLIQR